MVGYVTSAAFGYRTGKRLALGYIEAGAGGPGDGFVIEVLGRPCTARCVAPHVYDAGNVRVKG